MDDPYEKPDDELLKERMNELGQLSKGVKTLQEALPAFLGKSQGSLSDLVTMLAHEDISQKNIFVDDAGAPVALLDWENILLQPLLFLTRTSAFLDSEEEFEEPEWEDLSQGEYANPEERARFIDSNEEWYVRLDKAGSVEAEEVDRSRRGLRSELGRQQHRVHIFFYL